MTNKEKQTKQFIIRIKSLVKRADDIITMISFVPSHITKMRLQIVVMELEELENLNTLNI